jgi:serine phosphatase RsbU (regulator of sigma subunit)
VETIRDTENKADLAGKDIAVKSKDEIAVLGDTINDMTHGLVKAALASQDLTIGKEVQKMFIPLETDSQGNKLTTGRSDTKGAEFFGYYEGAKGVSGDYFDYLKLDDRYFAVIKCDVAGKGVPAALIMIEVATLFLNFFKTWKPTQEGMKIERVVYQINDFIESRGFKGRFAAFTLCLFDSVTGEVHFCNAGDNIVHWYDASEGRMKLTTLPESPTAGVFPNFMIEMKGGYTVQKLKLDVGDTLLLYTDGIEEAKRRFRDKNYKEIECTEGGAEKDTPHGNHSVGQADEELGYERVEGILDAVMKGGRFSLSKYHNPNPDEKLEFDFSACKGSVEEMIMALVAVEKVFRLYRDPSAGEESRVMVDKKVDAFLKDRFDQYRVYCARTRDNPEHPEYMYYTHIKEDDQYDDLTILGIRKK